MAYAAPDFRQGLELLTGGTALGAPPCVSFDGLTPEQAQSILKRDAANLVARVRAGKPLSPADRRQLASISAGGSAAPGASGHVRTQVELAAALGVDRKTIKRWMKMEGCPGAKADGRYSVEAWLSFKAKQKAGVRDGDLDPADEKARQILLQNERLELQIAVMRKEYVASVDVEKWVGAMVLQAKRVLLGLPSSIAPQVVGLSVPEAEELMRDRFNEALLQLHTDPLGGALGEPEDPEVEGEG